MRNLNGICVSDGQTHGIKFNELFMVLIIKYFYWCLAVENLSRYARQMSISTLYIFDEKRYQFWYCAEYHIYW